MFEQLGLNIGRQPDNASNPRPDNRSGWLSGETPDVVEELLQDPAPAEPVGLNVRLWDPSTQLRFRPKRSVSARPDGASNKVPVA
jgi:biotin synthase